jgi:hypothetical protein
MKAIWKKFSILAITLIFVLSSIPANIYAETSDDRQAEGGEGQPSTFMAASDEKCGEDIYNEISDFVNDYVIALLPLNVYKNLAKALVLKVGDEAKNLVSNDEELQARIDAYVDEINKSIDEYTTKEKVKEALEKFETETINFIKKEIENRNNKDNNEGSGNSTDNSTKPADSSSKIEELRSKGITTINKHIEQANVKGDVKTVVMAAGLEAMNAVMKANSEAEINSIIAALDQKIVEAKMTFNGKTVTASKKKKTTFTVKKAFKIENAPSALTFTKINKAGKGKIKVKKSGKITVAKGLKKGTYKVKVRVVTKATSTVQSFKKETVVKVKVK